MPPTSFAREQLEWSPLRRSREPAPRSRAAQQREGRRPVLLAGAGAECAAALDELAKTLPAGTRVQHASAFWEALERAEHCSMVMIGGDLEDGTAESLAQTLAQRHPALPLVRLKGDRPAGA